MKQETGKIIGERLEKLNKYLRKKDGQFRVKPIHTFRLEVKKLRSLLHLLTPDGSKVFIPQRLKKLYKLLGKIRLGQLHHRAILQTTDILQAARPAQYIELLENETRGFRKEAKKHMRKMKPLKVKDFGRALPETISKTESFKYFILQTNRLENLLHLPEPDEESLHEIRKIMKNMLYDLQYLKDWNIRNLELNQKRMSDMKILESKIGEFHDIYTSQKLLEKTLKTPDGIPEEHCLSLILSHWQDDKENLKRQITDLMNTVYRLSGQ
jgi:CHAD domain-containing protein